MANLLSIENQATVKVKTLEKALRLIEVLAEQDIPLSLSKLARFTDLNPATAYRLLQTLCQHGYVEKVPGTSNYKLGLKIFFLSSMGSNRYDLRESALPILQSFACENQETIYLAVLSNQSVIYIDCAKAGGPMQFGFETGVPVPALQTSAGKVIIAYFNSEYQSKFLARAEIPQQSVGSILNDLSEIRKNGHASGVNSLNPFFYEISYPIFNQSCQAALSIFKPFSAAGELVIRESLHRNLQNAATQIGRELRAL
jgi:IclR family KDG regulon transcriptional repressor